MELLLERKKETQLSAVEIDELAAIAELARIFTHVDAMLAAQPGNQ